MSFGDRYASSSYQKIFGDSPRFPTSSSRMSGASPRGAPALRSVAAARSSASSVSVYRRLGRSPASFTPVPGGSLDLTQTSVVNNEFKVIRTNEKEQLQVGDQTRGGFTETHITLKYFKTAPLYTFQFQINFLVFRGS